jgi:hypothetical protein
MHGISHIHEVVTIGNTEKSVLDSSGLEFETVGMEGHQVSCTMKSKFSVPTFSEIPHN